MHLYFRLACIGAGTILGTFVGMDKPSRNLAKKIAQATFKGWDDEKLKLERKAHIITCSLSVMAGGFFLGGLAGYIASLAADRFLSLK